MGSDVVTLLVCIFSLILSAIIINTFKDDDNY